MNQSPKARVALAPRFSSFLTLSGFCGVGNGEKDDNSYAQDVRETTMMPRHRTHLSLAGQFLPQR